MSLNDVQLLLADVAIVIILARLLGALARRLGQPPVLGEILVGILLGPTFFHARITNALFPPSVIPPLTALADIGLVLFMFVVGYEVDLRLIRGRERVAVAVSTGSVILPLVLGSLLGVWLAHRNHVRGRVHLRAVHRHRHGRHRVSGAGPDPDRPGPAPHPHRRDRAGQCRDSRRAGLGAAGRGGGAGRQRSAVEGAARHPLCRRDVRSRQAAAERARPELPEGGPPHPGRPGHRAGRAAAFLLRHQLDGPAFHLRRVPVRHHHAPRAGHGHAGGDPRAAGAALRRGAAPAVLRGSRA